MKPGISAEASGIEAKLRAGRELRLRVIDRPDQRGQLRLCFSPTDVVSQTAVESLIRRGRATLDESTGIIRHGGIPT